MADPRQRYFHGAVDVSTLYPNEARFDERAARMVPMLEASPVYDVRISLSFDGSDDPIYPGWLAPFLVWDAEAMALITGPVAGTLVIELDETEPGAADELSIAAAVALSTPGLVTTSPLWAPRERPRLLKVTPTGSDAGASAEILFKVHPVVPKWV